MFRFPAWRDGTTTLDDVPARQGYVGWQNRFLGILKRAKIRDLLPLWMLSLYWSRRRITVGSNRGFNNKFMIDIGSPLAAIYSTSTMEHHHFNMAINILQQVQKVIEK
jgi:hypothetical protein